MPESSQCPVLVLAPAGRDAAVAASLLQEIHTSSILCNDLAHLTSLLGEEVCCAIATEEVLSDIGLQLLSDWVSTQPTWSDFPFIVLTRRSTAPDRNPSAARITKTLGNVTFLERPFHPTTFFSVVGTAVRGRHRQFEARSRIVELHEGEARLRTALTAGQLGSWELDLSTHVFTATPECKAIFGRSANADFTYADFVASVHPDDLGQMQEAMRLSAERGVDYAIEYRNIWPDGTMHWAEIRARLVRDETPGLVRFVGVSSDITVRKESEGFLLRSNEMLEAKVRERTADLERAHQSVLEQIRQRERTEDLLRQVQKLEMIGQLSGGIAHDFNNLLMAILGNLELLRKQLSGDARAERLVDGAIRGAQRGAALTQRLLAFARQQDLQVEATQLSRLIRGMADLLERSTGPDIELRLELPEELPLTLVDANQIELAVLNLVINARDAMPDGGILSISVDVARSSGEKDLVPGEYVRVTVSDNGSGMDAATLAKATEPFFTTKGLGKGTGLGLSMIHGLARQLNGGLRLESEVGRGTRAALWLPVTSRLPARTETSVAPQAPGNRAGPVHRVTILVVDDDPLISTSTTYLLEDLGHAVVEADSGARALDILKNGQEIDLLLTDYSMPTMTGVQLAKAARELRPGLPVILATGYAELPQDADAKIPRLRKPYQQQQLVAEIEQALLRTSSE